MAEARAAVDRESGAERRARRAYSALLRLATPLLLARTAWRGRDEPGYREKWTERLGFGRPVVAAGAVDPRPAPLVWLHAVSLGETRAAEPLLRELRARLPGMRLLLTHGTATGREAGARLLLAGDRQRWLPWDTPGAVRRFLAREFGLGAGAVAAGPGLAPRGPPIVGVILETEVWPNLLHAAHAAGLSLVLANARLSEKSLAKGRRLRLLMAPALAAFSRVLAQTEADAARLRALGSCVVEVCGNLKYDMTPDAALLARGRAWRTVGAAALVGLAPPGETALARPLVVAASTREGEEAPLLAAWRARLAALPDGRDDGSAPPAVVRPRLLLVPRHPQRFDEVAALVQRSGLTLARRSAWGDAPPAGALAADVWLGDSLGEMALYFAAGDVALLGGSFAPLGGQNLIEAAACGCPLVLGPHTFNFAQAAEEALAAGAAERVGGIEAGVARACAIAANAALREAMAARGLAFASAHRGAAARMAGRIAALVERPATSRAAPGGHP